MTPPKIDFAALRWFEFRAPGGKTIAGYGTPAQAIQYCARLNRSRAADLYTPHPIPEDGAADAADRRDLGEELRAKVP